MEWLDIPMPLVILSGVGIVSIIAPSFSIPGLVGGSIATLQQEHIIGQLLQARGAVVLHQHEVPADLRL